MKTLKTYQLTKENLSPNLIEKLKSLNINPSECEIRKGYWNFSLSRQEATITHQDNQYKIWRGKPKDNWLWLENQ